MGRKRGQMEKKKRKKKQFYRFKEGAVLPSERQYLLSCQPFTIAGYPLFDGVGKAAAFTACVVDKVVATTKDGRHLFVVCISDIETVS